MTISPLGERLEFLDMAADRIWSAWWRDDGYPLEAVTTRLHEALGPQPIPDAFIAARGGVFLGTVSLIDSDMDERPQYSPWLAALWVEPEHRRQGVAEALMEAVLARAADAGVTTVYLCATPENAPYYARRGWQRIEMDVGGLDILARMAPVTPAGHTA